MRGTRPLGDPFSKGSPPAGISCWGPRISRRTSARPLRPLPLARLPLSAPGGGRLAPLLKSSSNLSIYCLSSADRPFGAADSGQGPPTLPALTKDVSFTMAAGYPSRRLGMESAVRRYVIRLSVGMASRSACIISPLPAFCFLLSSLFFIIFSLFFTKPQAWYVIRPSVGMASRSACISTCPLSRKCNICVGVCLQLFKISCRDRRRACTLSTGP